MMISAGANNELLPNEQQNDLLLTSQPPPRTSMPEEEKTMSLVDESSEKEHLVVLDDQETAGPSVIAAVVTPPPVLSDSIKEVPVVMDSNNRENKELISDDLSSALKTSAASAPDTLVKSSSEKVLKPSEALQTAATSPVQPAKARASLSSADAGSPKSPTKFDLLQGKYDASPSPPVMKKMTSPSSSPTSSSPMKHSPRRQKSPPTSNKVNSNNINNKLDSHIVSAPPLATAKASSSGTAASASAAASAADDSNNASNAQSSTQQQLVQEMARIEGELQRKKLQEEVRIATAAHAEAANSAPAWSSYAAAPTLVTTTTLESQLDSIINDDKATTAGLAASTTPNTKTAKSNLSSGRMIADLDDSVSMTSSRSLLSTPGTDRSRLTTTTAAAVFATAPPLNDEKMAVDPPAASAAQEAASSSLDKLAAAAAKMQQPTTSSPRNKHANRQGSSKRKLQHGSNRSLRSANSSNRSIQSIPEELQGDNNSALPATEGSALTSTTSSTVSPSSAAATANNNTSRRPPAGNCRSSSGRNVHQQQQGEKTAVPAVGGGGTTKTEWETRKMELSKRMEDLKETKRKLEINSSKGIFRQPATPPAEQADPTLLVSIADHRSVRGDGVGADKTMSALAEEGQIIKRKIPDDDFVAIPDDVYNMFFLSNVGGQAFFYALYVFALKMALYTFLGTDAVQVPMPENVETKVKVTQFLMLPVAVTMQDDLITTIYLVSNVKYWPGVKENNPDASRWKWKLANLFRGIDGLFSLFINFVVLLKAEQVLGLFLNFAALQFLQNIDNLAVRLASDGYLTERLETVAQNVKDCKLPRLHNEFLRTMDSLLFFFTFAILLVAWSVINFA